MTMDCNPTLYEAAINSLASDSSSNNTFIKVMEFVTGSTFKDVLNVKGALYATETVIRQEFSLSAMPNPWRSAKSVVLGAISLGLSLLDENGQPKGKTKLQNEIKVLKKALETPETDYAKATKTALKLKELLIFLSETERISVRDILKD